MNGWTNYETWNVNLWFDDAFTEEAHDCAANAKGDKYFSARENATRDLADIIEEFVREQAGEYTAEASFVSDLLGAALSSVDWYEIAETYISDIPDDEFGDNEDEEEGEATEPVYYCQPFGLPGKPSL